MEILPNNYVFVYLWPHGGCCISRKGWRLKVSALPYRGWRSATQAVNYGALRKLLDTKAQLSFSGWQHSMQTVTQHYHECNTVHDSMGRGQWNSRFRTLLYTPLPLASFNLYPFTVTNHSVSSVSPPSELSNLRIVVETPWTLQLVSQMKMVLWTVQFNFKHCMKSSLNGFIFCITTKL